MALPLRLANIDVNASDSSMPRLRRTATTAQSAPMKKGIRHPQSCSCLSVSTKCCSTMRTASASSCPMISVTYWKLEYSPLRLAGAISLRYVALVPYSPPTLKPCRSRANTSTMGAPTPIVAYPGVSAIINEPAHMSVTDSVSADLRPRRSAYHPSSHPPMGRTRKPIANAPAAFRS